MDNNKYKNGKIYSIRSHQTDDIYIGSTINDLYKRLYEHKQKYKKWIEGKTDYTSSYDIIKYDDCYIELVENFPCNNRNELCRKEGEHIRACNCVNKNIAGQTFKEYIKQYIMDNKDEISKKKKEYYNKNKDENLEKKKEYNAKNKDIISDYKKQYYAKNKDKISEYNKQYHLKKKLTKS